MSNKTKNNKCRNFMYTQELKYLPNGMTPEDIYKIVDEQLKPKKWAGIVHDKDLKEDGITKAVDNLHVMMQFDNARSLSNIAKILGDKEQYIEIWKGNVSNGFSYLVHRTDNAKNKYQYELTEVTSNFDYIKEMNRTSKKVTKVNNSQLNKKIDTYLNLLAVGETTLNTIKTEIDGATYAKYANKLEKANELRLFKKANELYKTMKENNETVNVYWFYGETETGKTRVAEELLSKKEYYKSTTSKDPFQLYEGEENIILDELRPNVIPYSELLSLLNPYSFGKITMSSRFHNKELCVKTFIITSPFDPVTYLDELILNKIDSGKQLYRRLTEVIKFDKDYIYKMEYNDKTNRYDIKNRKINNYSNNSTYNNKTKDNLFGLLDIIGADNGTEDDDKQG